MLSFGHMRSNSIYSYKDPSYENFLPLAQCVAWHVDKWVAEGHGAAYILWSRRALKGYPGHVDTAMSDEEFHLALKAMLFCEAPAYAAWNEIEDFIASRLSDYEELINSVPILQ
jgi:hypothetical protein